MGFKSRIGQGENIAIVTHDYEAVPVNSTGGGFTEIWRGSTENYDTVVIIPDADSGQLSGTIFVTYDESDVGRDIPADARWHERSGFGPIAPSDTPVAIPITMFNSGISAVRVEVSGPATGRLYVKRYYLQALGS